MKATPISLNTPTAKKREGTIHPDTVYVRYACPYCKQTNSVRLIDYTLTRKESADVDGEVFVITFPCGNDDCQEDLKLEFGIEATEASLRINLLGL